MTSLEVQCIADLKEAASAKMSTMVRGSHIAKLLSSTALKY